MLSAIRSSASRRWETMYPKTSHAWGEVAVPRNCTVCFHPDSLLINEALILEGKSNRAVASQYGLDREAIRRHKSHIPDLLLKARDDLEGYDTDTILRKIEDLERETLEQLEEAKADKGDRRIVLAAIREQRQNLELLARLVQLIDASPRVNILITPQVQQVIISALSPYPEARQAVADALATLEAAA
jgi:hypothetical protein